MNNPTAQESPKSNPESLGLSDYPDSRWLRSLRQKALKWFESEQRDLPWRKKNTPYRVWVSEIMLQQTQVQTVIEYFNRFMASFPTIKKLAAAPEADVLAHWEGLGYYRRARNLHAAAKEICQKHKGKFPTEFEDVLSLPGIGRYTAGAILSISQNQHHPILEGNTYRLYARLLAMTANPRDREPEKHLWKFAADLLPSPRSQQQPGILNQALMEIGSLVCKPKNPDCASCPFRTICPTNLMGLQGSIPRSGKKLVYEDLHQALVIVKTSANKCLARQSEVGEWWSGLWDFLRVDLTHINSDDNAREKKSDSEFLSQQIQNQFGVSAIVSNKPFDTFKHGVTKYRITLDCYVAEMDKKGGRTQPSRQSKIPEKSLAQVDELPLNITARKAFNRWREISEER